MTVTKVVTVVKTKKGPNVHKKKGELMENDQDAMEVSLGIIIHNFLPLVPVRDPFVFLKKRHNLNVKC